jgi:myosin-crossreactive antigen
MASPVNTRSPLVETLREIVMAGEYSVNSAAKMFFQLLEYSEVQDSACRILNPTVLLDKTSSRALKRSWMVTL